MNFNKQLTKIENKYFKNNDEKEAARAYNEAAEEDFKEFAKLNIIEND